MRAKRPFLISLLLLLPMTFFGQAVIGSVSKPASYSLLELSTSTIKGGVRMPQITTVERDNLTTADFISDPKAKGLTVYNETTEAIEFWDGEKWSTLNQIEAINGLTRNNSYIELGGSLNKATTVAMGANNLDLSSTGGRFTVGGTAFSVSLGNQVGIGTATPNQSAALDITATNKGFLLPRVTLKGTTDITTVPSPAIGLLVYNTAQAGAVATQVYANKIYTWNGSRWSQMVDQDAMTTSVGNVVDGLGIPRPAVFQLETKQSNFLSTADIGGSQSIPMSLVTNSSTNSISFDKENNIITFQPGTYIITFVYEATHNVTACTLSSYFIDFPTSNTSRRIHTTATHAGGGLSNHGGTVTYTAKLTQNVSWNPRLGRGQSGNCKGTGMILSPFVTQLSILNISN